MAKRFQNFDQRKIDLAKGDSIRITRNGETKGGHRLNNGAIYQIKGFTRSGDIKLANDWVLPKDYGSVAPGFVTTSYSAQGKTVDRVIIAQSSTSFPASSSEQLYVSASRGRESVAIYTDDKEQLKNAVSRASERMSATAMMDGKNLEKNNSYSLQQHWIRMRQLARTYQERLQQYASEKIKEVNKSRESLEAFIKKSVSKPIIKGRPDHGRSIT